jgi:acyl-CoA synthetase (AMP-forming)/AMP-acid ligase II
MENFSQRLIQHLKNQPQKVILHLQKSGIEDAHLSYEELIRGSARYSRELKLVGIAPGDVVILILQHSLDLVYAYFGAILLGAVPSIMPFLTEKLLPEKYRHDLNALIAITKPAAIITYKEFEPEIGYLFEDKSIKGIILTEDVEKSGINDINETLYGGLDQNPDHIVLLQHSSGTTGLQKGVALSHTAVLNQLESYQKAIRLNEDDVIVSWLPLYHDMGLIASFLMPILTGVPLVLMSPFDWVRAPHKLMQAISEYHGSLCWLPNFAYNFCAKKIRSSDLEEVDLSSLRAVINCSEPMRYESHMMFFDRFKEYGFKESAFATSYAMAENVFAVTQDGIQKPVTYDRIDLEKFQHEKIAVPAKADNLSVVMVSGGPAIENSEIKIVSDQGIELPERQLGEILIKSNCMLTEYYLRPEETEKSLVDGWFKTGDLGYLAGGELYISGRKKDLIIVGGKNIYPQDIEAIVMEVEGVHPGRTVAFGIYNEEKGTEDVVVVAEIEPTHSENERTIGEEIRKRVTQSTAVALRHVFLVDEMWLIKTSSGKTARNANKAKYLKEVLGIHVG